MPAIHLFERRCLLGGDDLQIPCILAILLRFLQVVVLSNIIFWHLHQEAKGTGSTFWEYLWFDAGDNEQCRQSHLFALVVFLYGLSSVLWGTVSALWEYRLFRTSGIGCPTQHQPRSSMVERLLEFKLIPMSILEFIIVLMAVAIGVLAPQYYRCHNESIATDHLWWIAFGLLWLSQVAEVFVAAVFLRQLSWAPRRGETAGISHTIVVNNNNNSSHHGGSYGLDGIVLQTHRHEQEEELWVSRCTQLWNCLGASTCFAFGGRDLDRSNYMIVARALADYFERGDIFDLVPSDIVMGMMVLQKVQRHRVLQARSEVLQLKHDLERQESVASLSGLNHRPSPQQTPLMTNPMNDTLDRSRSDVSVDSARKSVYILQSNAGGASFYETTSRTVLSARKDQDLRTMEEGAHFAKYQLAIYTIGLYVYQYPMTGMARIWCNSRCPCCCGRHGGRNSRDRAAATTVYGQDWCDNHKTALMMQAGIKDETSELIYLQLHSSFHDIPYSIMVDHRWKTVVVAIRGTFSIEDCITDVMVEPEKLDALGMEYDFDAAGQYCHAGILRCARAVMRDLKRHNLLDQLLLERSSDQYLPDYRLRIVGHSLGGGSAVLLSYMLKKQHPTLRCLTYGPPGCSLSWKMATACKEWCTSFLVDSDLVPRLSLDAMDHLRDEVLSLIGRIRISKFDVAQNVVRSPCCCSLNDNLGEAQEEVLEETLETILAPAVVSTQYQEQLRQFRSSQIDRKSQRGVSRSIQLFPPGQLVHLMKTGEAKTLGHAIAKCLTCCTTNRGIQYTPVSIQNDDLPEIVISPTMWFDHFPNRICAVLERVANEFGLEDGVFLTEETTIQDPEQIGNLRRRYSPVAAQDVSDHQFG